MLKVTISNKDKGFIKNHYKAAQFTAKGLNESTFEASQEVFDTLYVSIKKAGFIPAQVMSW